VRFVGEKKKHERRRRKRRPPSKSVVGIVARRKRFRGAVRSFDCIVVPLLIY